MEEKVWWKSKGIWTGIITVVLGCYEVWLGNQATFGINWPAVPDAVFAVLGFFGLYTRAVANTTITRS